MVKLFLVYSYNGVLIFICAWGLPGIDHSPFTKGLKYRISYGMQSSGFFFTQRLISSWLPESAHC